MWTTPQVIFYMTLVELTTFHIKQAISVVTLSIPKSWTQIIKSIGDWLTLELIIHGYSVRLLLLKKKISLFQLISISDQSFFLYGWCTYSYLQKVAVWLVAWKSSVGQILHSILYDWHIQIYLQM